MTKDFDRKLMLRPSKDDIEYTLSNVQRLNIVNVNLKNFCYTISFISIFYKTRKYREKRQYIATLKNHSVYF